VELFNHLTSQSIRYEKSSIERVRNKDINREKCFI
jgi:hypothetical protein